PFFIADRAICSVRAQPAFPGVNISDFLHTSARHLQPRAVLQSPVTVLLGVSDRAADVLRELNIHTVFDLATSRLFGNAAAVTAAGNGATSVFGRFGAAPSDVIATSGRAYPVEDLHAKPLELLDGIG